jgi:hypothetical protein
MSTASNGVTQPCAVVTRVDDGNGAYSKDGAVRVPVCSRSYNIEASAARVEALLAHYHDNLKGSPASKARLELARLRLMTGGGW